MEKETTIREAFNDYCLGIKRLEETTQREYISKLKIFVNWAEEQNPPVTLETLKQKTIRLFMDDLTRQVNPRTKQPISTSTQHGYARTLKAFLSWLGREEDYEDIVSERLARKVEMPSVEDKILEIYSDRQINAIFEACTGERNAEWKARAKAIVSVLLDTGIRAHELVTLKREHLYFQPVTSEEKSYIRVHGKYNKWREIPLGDEAAIALRRYLRKYHNDEIEEVFIAKGGGPLTIYGLNQLIERLCERANVSGVERIVHAFRHTFAVKFLENGGDVYVLSRLMGHSSVKVTEIYLRAMRSKQIRKNASSVLDSMKG